MRPELEEIKYIEDYFLNQLSDSQKKEFEERLNTDAEFAKNVKLQKILMKRVTRLGIKHTVAMSHRKHTQRDTFLFKRRPNKNFFRSFFTLILIIVIGYLVITNESDENNESPRNDTTKTLPADSLNLKKNLDSLEKTSRAISLPGLDNK